LDLRCFVGITYLLNISLSIMVVPHNDITQGFLILAFDLCKIVT
jgi:hypothetical protein